MRPHKNLIFHTINFACGVKAKLLNSLLRPPAQAGVPGKAGGPEIPALCAGFRQSRVSCINRNILSRQLIKHLTLK